MVSASRVQTMLMCAEAQESRDQTNFPYSTGWRLSHKMIPVSYMLIWSVCDLCKLVFSSQPQCLHRHPVTSSPSASPRMFT